MSRYDLKAGTKLGLGKRRVSVQCLLADAGMPGSEIQAPMAVVIPCGLLTSTALNHMSKIFRMTPTRSGDK